MSDIVLEAKGIYKYFPGTEALKNVNFELRKGEIHALVGENGAGKSTFVKILTGVYSMSLGRIKIEGNEVKIRNPLHAESLGITAVHQNIAYIPLFDVPTNMFMNVSGKVILDKKYKAKLREKARNYIDQLGIELPLNVPCGELTPSQLQTMSLARAFSKSPKILLADEVTSSLDRDEIEKLFKQLRKLREKGVSIIYITHHLDEVFELCDRVTIFKDGVCVNTHEVSSVSMEQVVREMTGKILNKNRIREPVRVPANSRALLVVKDLSDNIVKHVSFSLEKGEILGVTGLVGAGKTEIAHMLFGVTTPKSGEFYLEGKKCHFKSPSDAVKNGIYLVPEDRLRDGIIPDLSITWNMTLPVLNKVLNKFKFINNKHEKNLVQGVANKLSVKYASLNQRIKYLSGGNQQKVITGKAMLAGLKVCIFDEPTQGVDVGARREIYSQITKIAEDGKAVLVCSSDIEEIMTLCDRVIVLRKGSIVAEKHITEVNKEELALLCQGLQR